MADKYIKSDVSEERVDMPQETLHATYGSEHQVYQTPESGPSSAVGDSVNASFGDFSKDVQGTISDTIAPSHQHIITQTAMGDNTPTMSPTDSHACSDLGYKESIQHSWNLPNIADMRSDFEALGKTTYNILPEVYRHRQRISGAKYKDAIATDKATVYNTLEHQIGGRYPDPVQFGYPIARNFQSNSTMDHDLYERMSAVERASIDFLTANCFNENYAMRNISCESSSKKIPIYSQSTTSMPHQTQDKIWALEEATNSESNVSHPSNANCGESGGKEEEGKAVEEPSVKEDNEKSLEPIKIPTVLKSYTPKRPRFTESFTDGVSIEEAQIGLMKTIAFLEANPSISENYIEPLWQILDHLEKYKNKLNRKKGVSSFKTIQHKQENEILCKIGKHKKRDKIACKKTHVCTICGKSFAKPSYLRRHCYLHTGEKPHKCTECNKGFADPWNLRTHMRTHTGEKPYMCSMCGKGCSTHGNLQIHMRFHSGEKPFKCLTCGKCFTQSSTLKEHNRTHTGERPYMCTTCGKAFLHSCDLQAHARIHTGEKPFECSKCGKRFAQSSNLHSHLKQHTGAKPFQCEICGQSFAQKFVLNSHKRVHTGERPYVCSICAKTFSHSGSLHHHMKMHSKQDCTTKMHEQV